MKWCFLLLFFTQAFAASFQHTTQPERPVANAPFELTIQATISDFDDEPYFSFDPKNLEVLSRSIKKTRTVPYLKADGTTGEHHYWEFHYQLKGEKGFHQIRDLELLYGEESKTQRTLSLRIYDPMRAYNRAFLETELSQSAPYLHQAVEVKTYFYYREITADQYDVKQYPKLKGFLKRFHIISGPRRPERVQKGGAAFTRELVYHSTVFPSQTGSLAIDSVHLELNYSRLSNYRKRNYKQKLMSKRIKLTVLPLPPSALSSTLVGRHKVKLSTIQKQYAIDQPIEVRLTIEGNGLLEQFDPPPLYTHSNLEEFDSQIEMHDLPDGSKQKVIHYTFMARGPIQIPERTLTLSQFSPTENKLTPVIVTLPALHITRTAPLSAPKEPEDKPIEEDVSTPINLLNVKPRAQILGPLWEESPLSSWNLALAVLCLSIVVLVMLHALRLITEAQMRKRGQQILPKQIQIQDLHRYLYHKAICRSLHSSLVETVIESEQLSKETKLFLKDAIETSLKKEFLDGEKYFIKLSSPVRKELNTL